VGESAAAQPEAAESACSADVPFDIRVLGFTAVISLRPASSLTDSSCAAPV
jgi:hypothetical protein